MLAHQCILPVVQPTKDGLKQIIFPGTWKSATEWQVTLSELGQSCRTVVEHAVAMLLEDPMPELNRGKVPSLYTCKVPKSSLQAGCRVLWFLFNLRWWINCK